MLIEQSDVVGIGVAGMLRPNLQPYSNSRSLKPKLSLEISNEFTTVTEEN